MKNIKRALKQEEYKFLESNEQLKDRLILLALGGSHAYGTNNEDSDIDIRGCAQERVSDLIGFSKFEQFIDDKTDTVIYSFNKLIRLLVNCNPNTVEILGCKPEHYLYLNDTGKELLKNRKLFLSQRCINTFGGYALQQLNRLTNALARDRFSQSDKEKHILNSLKSAILSFNDKYKSFNKSSIELEIKESAKEDLNSEIFINMHLGNYPLRDTAGMLSEMQNILRTYGKLNHRNKKKSVKQLDKHAMHLLRLYLMAIDILEKEEIITYRKDDIDLLMSVRNGKFRREDGTYDDSFFEMVSEYEKKFKYAAKNTSLPVKPDKKAIEEFVLDVNAEVIKEEM